MKENCNHREKLISLIDKWNSESEKYREIPKDIQESFNYLRQELKKIQELRLN